MANKTRKNTAILTDEVIAIVASRAKFTKNDVKAVLDELKILFEECIVKGVDLDLKGLIHVNVVDMEYTKAPGIIGHHGKKDFNRHTKRIRYQVPLNFKTLLREQMKQEKVVDKKEE